MRLDGVRLVPYRKRQSDCLPEEAVSVSVSDYSSDDVLGIHSVDLMYQGDVARPPRVGVGDFEGNWIDHVE